VEKSKILQVMGPALAAAAVLVLVGALITSSEWAGTPPTGSKAVTPGKHSTPQPAVTVPKEEFNADGMSSELPPKDAPEWKPAGDGMEVWDVKEGTVDKPCPAGATVTIHYTGWTLGGTVFDSSLKSMKSRATGEPAVFPLGSLIKGWQIGIPGMKPGGIRRLKIPAPLGYGAAGSPPDIPPNATLIFEIKLLGFN
jgi:FKBP-type peptidyl-prolyl cis-trans isomerase